MPMLRRRCRWRTATHSFIVLLLCISSGNVASQAPQKRSDAGLVVLYAGLVRHGLTESMAKCSSRECEALRSFDSVVEATDGVDLGRIFLFADDVWTFDLALSRGRLGVSDVLAAGELDHAQVFVSRPIAQWHGDLLLIASSTAPQRLSIVRIGSLDAPKPTMTVLYDSMKRHALGDETDAPLGSVYAIEVLEGQRLHLRERSTPGSRDPSTGRTVLLQISSAAPVLRLIDKSPK